MISYHRQLMDNSWQVVRGSILRLNSMSLCDSNTTYKVVYIGQSDYIRFMLSRSSREGKCPPQLCPFPLHNSMCRCGFKSTSKVPVKEVISKGPGTRDRQVLLAFLSQQYLTLPTAVEMEMAVSVQGDSRCVSFQTISWLGRSRVDMDLTSLKNSYCEQAKDTMAINTSVFYKLKPISNNQLLSSINTALSRINIQLDVVHLRVLSCIGELLQLPTFLQQQFYLYLMSHLYELQRTRLKLYGQMLKKDLFDKKTKDRQEKEQQLRRDSLDLQAHIENTKRFDLHRKKELKQQGYALKEDNVLISTMRKSPLGQHTYAEDGSSFLQSIHELDSKRLNGLKQSLNDQYHQNQDHISNKRVLQQRIGQIERVENERHVNRIKEWQHESLRNYEDIKRKHQQDMGLYQKHKQLIDQNNNYRDNLQSFTQVKGGIMGRYNRNEYFERKNNLMANQSELKRQMEFQQMRKYEQQKQYKKSVGNLQSSMLASILSKPNRYEPAEFHNTLKAQMLADQVKKQEQKKQIKEKMQPNNIYGGVTQGRQRENMINIIDKGLGLTNMHLSESKNSISNKPDPYHTYHHRINHAENNRINHAENNRINHENPQDKHYQIKAPRIASRGRQNSKQMQKSGYSQRQVDVGKVSSSQNMQKGLLVGDSRGNSSSNKSYLRFDVITGKQKYYVGE